MDKFQEVIDRFFAATRNRRFIYELSFETQEARTFWQHYELYIFMGLIFGAEPRILANNPIKIPSGKYVETLRVERTQQDLNNEMANDLAKLPRYQVYTKLTDESQGTQIVQTHRIQTHPLPAITNADMEAQAIANGHTLGMERDEIDAEIRARQSRWGRGGSPPPQSGRL
jgi:hypothetical protein